MQVPPSLAVMLTNVDPGGRVSVSETLLAAPGPLLSTRMVMVAVPPAGTGSGLTVWLDSTMSADCAQAPVANTSAPRAMAPRNDARRKRVENDVKRVTEPALSRKAGAPAP